MIIKNLYSAITNFCIKRTRFSSILRQLLFLIINRANWTVRYSKFYFILYAFLCATVRRKNTTALPFHHAKREFWTNNVIIQQGSLFFPCNILDPNGLKTTTQSFQLNRY